MSAWQAWLGLAFILVLVEVATTGFFVFWFGLGAVLAALSAFFGAGTVVQLAIFVGASFILVVFTRPLARRLFNGRDVRTNAEALIGELGVVQETIKDKESGLVRMGGEVWTAVLPGPGRASRGTRVRVLEVRGVRLVVEPAGEEPAKTSGEVEKNG
ncbi:MAG: NfeD family protein [Bacillota bacterium]